MLTAFLEGEVSGFMDTVWGSGIFAAQYAGLYRRWPWWSLPGTTGHSRKNALLTWLMYAFEALLYVLGIYLGIYLGIHPSPDTPTLSFIAFLLAGRSRHGPIIIS